MPNGGVYVLRKGEEIVYVGYTKRFDHRARKHQDTYLPTEIETITVQRGNEVLEHLLIERLRPRYNKMLFKGKTPRPTTQAESVGRDALFRWLEKWAGD